MDVSFASKKLQRTCSSEKEMRRVWGTAQAKKIQQRLMELQAARMLDDISHLPPARCHELAGDRKGQLAVDLVHPYRLIFEPDHNPIPQKADGGLDWTQVTRVLVRDIGDYHG